MRRAMLRDLLAHKGRVAMTMVAIALGVSFIVAGWVVTDSTVAVMTGAAGRSAEDVVSVQAEDRDRPALRSDDLDALRALPGAERASGVYFGRSGLVGAGGKLSGSGLEKAGTNWDRTGRFALVSGREPTGRREAAVSASGAARVGLRPGDTARVLLGDGRTEEFTVSGVFEYRTLGMRSDSEAGAEPVPSVAYAADTAADLLGNPLLDRVELRAAPGTGADALAADARALGLDGGLRTATGPELAAEAERSAATTAWQTRSQLLPFVLVALAVAMFIIANTFTMLVTQRTRRFALLRAVGATRAQVRRTVVLEAAVLGVVGATLGAAAGVALGLLGITLMTPDGEIAVYSVAPAGIATGYATAVPVTVLAAYSSARRAGAVPPMAALRAETATPAGAGRAPSAIGVLALVVGTAAVIATASPSLGSAERIAGISGAVLSAAGVVLLTPALVTAALRPLLAFTARRGGTAVRMGVRNAARDPRRTAATATALMVGLTLACAFATLTASFTTMITETIKANVPAGTTVLESAAGDGTPLRPADVERVRDLPEVSAANAGRDVFARITYADGSTERIITAVDAEGLDAVLRPRLTAGTADLDSGVLIAQNQADMLGLDLGDRISLDLGSGGAVHTRVTGVYAATEMQASIFFDAEHAPTELKDRVSTVYATGSDPDAARDAIADAFADRPDVGVTDRDGLVEDRVHAFRVGMLVMYAMFGFAVVIAAFGVVNTLALSVAERTREIGVLRAVGASRSLIRRSIRWESLLISLFGGVLGVIVGLWTGAVLQQNMLGRPLSLTIVPYPMVATALVGMVLVGTVAAIWPAHRAARTDLLPAVSAQ